MGSHLLDDHRCPGRLTAAFVLCESCFKTGRCVVNDDYQQVYPKLIEARGTLAGPVGAPSGRLAQIYQESVRHEYTIIPQYLYHS